MESEKRDKRYVGKGCRRMHETSRDIVRFFHILDYINSNRPQPKNVTNPCTASGQNGTILGMKKLIQKIFGKNKKGSKQMSRIELEKRVEQGTERAIKEYGYVFKKLAEFDRT